eukprot:74651_1
MKRSLARRLEFIATEVGVGRKKSAGGGQGQFFGALNALQSNAPSDNEELELKTALRMRLIMLGAIKSLDCIRKDDVNECASQIVDRIKQHRLEAETSSGAAATNTKGVVHNLDPVVSRTVSWGSERNRSTKHRSESGSGGGDIKKQKGSSSTLPTLHSPIPAWAARLPSVGDRVAAKVASHDLYILTQVEACNRNGTYIVRDADAQQGCRTYTLRRSVLLKLPKVNESTKGYFTVGRRVMAMYPRTTSFYPATVSAPAPRRDSNGLEMVEVQFDDDEDEYGELPKISIPAHFIGLPPSISS